MAKKSLGVKPSTVIRPQIIIDPTECPFREYRDNELQPEFWGMGPSTFRAYSNVAKGVTLPKQPQDYVWADDQIQPLPRSVRQYLNGYQRAEDLALSRWEAEVVIFEENNGNKMSIPDIQLTHAQVLTRSSFCRNVLSACFMLELYDNVVVEHQWDGFNCTLGPEGWRAKYHIYSPGTKPGGGVQHRPSLSKNGCYLVRLFYLGAWRCVWVSDQVPVDASGAPLLPFAPIINRAPVSKIVTKVMTTTVSTPVVHLWPLLICKALLKLAAPDLNDNENIDCLDDEVMPEFDIIHALTGALVVNHTIEDPQQIWDLISSEVPMFSWDDDDDTQASTIRTKSTKKPTARDATVVKRGTMVYIAIKDTKNYPPYFLPGITPGYEMNLLISMCRDVPLKKPLPEPEVELWKVYRWVDWARAHGLYEAYDCPRTKFFKLNGLLKLSYAPHLLDVQSTESITVGFVKAELSHAKPSRFKDTLTSHTYTNPSILQHMKEELREWILFKPLHPLIKSTSVVYYPSMYELTTATNVPIFRITKGPPMKHLDILALKTAPLYLQIDGPELNTLSISLSMLHPRILANSGVRLADHIESAYLVLECFEWFKDCELAKTKIFIRTCGYKAEQVTFPPGRHFCRIWVHSQMNWHIMLVSESSLHLGSRDQIQNAAVHECPWVSRFLSNLGSAFNNWFKSNRSITGLTSGLMSDREFFRSYLPDLPWENEVVGYNRSLLHWMFKQALQAHLTKKLTPTELTTVFPVLRKFFRDPDFGFPPKQKALAYSLKTLIESDPCDCQMPEIEEIEFGEEHIEQVEETTENKQIVSKAVMDKLLTPPVDPITSNICELATEELPCGLLKEERSKMVRKHEAAILLQAYWRGTWARKCLNTTSSVPPEVLKILQDSTIGNQESLSCLMNEFFKLYPGAKYAYSVASGLSGVYGLHQHFGTSSMSPKCKWIPYFQEVFYCHAPCKVHFDVSSTIPHCTVAIYDCDTGKKLPQAYNAHKTFDFNPNLYGYTVMGHGSISEPLGINFEVHWQLTVLTSTAGAFHVCDNDYPCKELPLPPAIKVHIDEIFIPNRRNILGGIQLSIIQHEAVSFRVEATSPDIEMVAKLREVLPSGKIIELDSCSGVGEVFWPYIRLEPSPSKDPLDKRSTILSARSFSKSSRVKPPGKGAKSIQKLKSLPTEPRLYNIQVVAPTGWPLTVGQWNRVDEVRNSVETLKLNTKSVIKEKQSSAKPATGSSKDKGSKPAPPAIQSVHMPLPDDAYVQLECSLSAGRGTTASRDDERDVQFTQARLSWEQNEPGRNKRGADIRKQFRDEFLEVPPPPPSETENSTATLFGSEFFPEHLLEEEKKTEELAQGPTPVTEDATMEAAEEAEEEEVKYLAMPEQLRDKFKPLDFLSLCTKCLEDYECVVVSTDMADAAKNDRNARIKAEIERMQELQYHNEVYVLGRQRERCYLIEKLFVDGTWSPSLQQVLDERDEAINLETQLRILSANKKKQETKTKK